MFHKSLLLWIILNANQRRLSGRKLDWTPCPLRVPGGNNWHRLYNRQEGHPPLMQLPTQVLEQSPMMYPFEDSDPQHVECSPGVQTAENTARNIHLLDQDTQNLVWERIHMLEEEVKMKQETAQLHEMITQEGRLPEIRE